MDKYLVSIAFILLAFECGWLLQDLKIVDVPGLFNSRGEIQEGDPMGQIVHTKKEVRRRPNSSLVWEETDTAQSLYAYDAVLTLEQSAAEVSLIGDTHITLHENTLVTIEPPDANTTSEGPIRLRFRQGSMRAAMGRDPQSVSAGEWIVEATANTKLSIRSDGQNQFELETYEGQAKIINGKTFATTETLKAGQSIRMEPQKLSPVREVLELEWVYPKDGQRFYTHFESTQVPFQWKGSATGLKIFDHESLKPREVKFAQADVGAEKLTLPRGNYVVRLQNDTSTTFARVVSVWPAPKVHLITPLTRERVRFKTPVDFLWTQNRDVPNYIWEISTDHEFKNVIRSGKTDKNSITVGDLPLGEFFWRVRGQDEQGFEIPEIYHNTLHVIENPLAPPKLKAPQIKLDTGFNLWQWLLPEAQAADRPGKKLPKRYFAEFQWETVEGADTYVIEISDAPDFREPTAIHTIKKSSYKWRNFPLGKYYWRVAAQAQGETGLFSEVAYADLTSIPKGPIKPVTKETLDAQAPPIPQTSPTPAVVETPTKLIAEAEAKPTPTPPLRQQPAHLKWDYELQVGASGKYTHYRGPDFIARELGPVYGTVRAIVPADHKYSPWRLEGELERHTLRVANQTATPLQAPITRYMGRLTAINESPYKDHVSYGFAIHTQTFIYRRSDLELMDAYAPVFVGPVVDWLYFDENVETNYRLGAFVADPFTGKALSFEGKANHTWLLGSSPGLIFSITVEGKITTGVTWEKSFWGDGTGSLFLGVRW